ncbi:prolactin-3D4-like [Arvicola amphibius]|uniref:prolactin-3D4-like n=1 Tax=Arvicola amphibius TaxID=1047088 RepID=UPI0018E3A009|nr:prolactin-3D4-like [Arvicola amphibius]
MCLLLLLANLLLWENVSSTPDILSIKDLYDHVVERSHTNYDISADIYHEFNIKFAKASWLNDKVPIECHTASIRTPRNFKQIRETKTEDLLKAVMAISRAWDYPLIHLILATAALPTDANEMLQRINGVKNGIIELLDGLEILLSRTQPGAVENYPPHWSGLRELQSSDEDTHLFVMYNLYRCLKRDTQKVESYLKILKNRVIFKENY